MLAQTTVYAIEAVSHMNGPEEPYSLARDIARQTGISPAYLSKVINRLCRHGLVDARRGIGGGVRLGKNAKDISVLDVCRVMEEPILESNCFLKHGECTDSCVGHSKWSKGVKMLLSALEEIHISDL